MTCRAPQLVLIALVAAALGLRTHAAAIDSKEMSALSEAAKALPEKLDNKPLAFVPFVEQGPAELKGDLSDVAWSKAGVLTFLQTVNAQPIQHNTLARIFCTADALYIGIVCDEPAVDKLKDDGAIWERDGFEAFLLTGEETKHQLYYQIIVDAANKLEAWKTHVYPKHRQHALSEPWQPKLSSATAKSKTGWSAELKINFADLKLSAQAEKKEALWRLNLYRNRPGRNDEASQFYAWSPTITGAHHTPQRFGYLVVAPYASDKLIQRVLERGKAVTANPNELTVATEICKEVETLIQKLGSDTFEERNQSQERLRELMKEKRAQLLHIEEVLRKVETESDDTEIKSRARKLLQGMKQSGDDDEDPPPENVRIAPGWGG